MFSNIRSLIFKLDPETAHNLAIKSLKFNFIPNMPGENKDLILKPEKIAENIIKTIQDDTIQSGDIITI